MSKILASGVCCAHGGALQRSCFGLSIDFLWPSCRRMRALRQARRLVSRQKIGRVEASHSSAILGIHRHCPRRSHGRCHGRPRSSSPASERGQFAARPHSPNRAGIRGERDGGGAAHIALDRFPFRLQLRYLTWKLRALCWVLRRLRTRAGRLAWLE